jgi:peroxiredoxin
MTAEARPIAIGDVVPDVPLQTFDGREFRLSSRRGHPLLVVCVRYYG